MEKALAYASAHDLLERLVDHDLGNRAPVRRLRKDLSRLADELFEAMVPGAVVRVFTVSRGRALVVVVLSFGNKVIREIRLVKLERVEA